eukprot:c23705_g1_i1 orf=75-1082(+)
MDARHKEPNTAPQTEQWYPLTLGSTLKDQSATSFYSLRYEFKPASIDTSRPGSLHKSVENKVTVEFCNNQAGKPKVSFQGNSEDCKDLDAVLFFDGKSFRMERLHKAVKSLRHVRLPGESVSAAAGGSGLGAGTTSNVDHLPSPGHLNGGAGLASNVNVEKITQKGIPVQVEEIPIGQPDTSVKRKANKTKLEVNASKGQSFSPLASPLEPRSDMEIQVDVADEGGEHSVKRNKTGESQRPDANIDEVVEEHESDYEIEDVDVSEDEEGNGDMGGVNAADALRAQAAAENQKQESSSESGSSGSGSGSGSSGSGSGSSSSGSDDDEESGSSGDDI